jgi:hypothetical protein
MTRAAIHIFPDTDKHTERDPQNNRNTEKKKRKRPPQHRKRWIVNENKEEEHMKETVKTWGELQFKKINDTKRYDKKASTTDAKTRQIWILARNTKGVARGTKHEESGTGYATPGSAAINSPLFFLVCECHP